MLFNTALNLMAADSSNIDVCLNYTQTFSWHLREHGPFLL